MEEGGGLVRGEGEEAANLEDPPALVGSVVRPPPFGQLVEACAEDLGDFGEDPGEEGLLLGLGVGRHQWIWRIPQISEALAEGQGEQASGLLDGPLCNGLAQRIA